MPPLPAPFPIRLTSGDIDYYRLVLSLLPSLYRTQEDLQVILRLLAGMIEDLKEDIDGLPDLVDFKRCPDALLAYLANELGLPRIFPDSGFDHLRYRRIGEALGIFRHKSTKVALLADLKELGWKGSVVEGKDRTLRLNVRGRLCSPETHLDGPVHNHGTALFYTEGSLEWQRIQKAVEFHRPASARFYFFGEHTSGWDEPFPEEQAALDTVTQVSGANYFASLFTLMDSTLCGPDRLTLSGAALSSEALSS